MRRIQNFQQSLCLPFFLSLLVIFLIFYPYFHQKFTSHLAILELFFALIMISGISIFIHRKRLLFGMSVLAALILFCIIFLGMFKIYTLLLGVLFLELVFFSIVFLYLLNYIFDHQEVTLSSLYGAITSYLVLGIIFALLYTIASTLSPEIFQYTATPEPDLEVFPHPSFFSEALYFSFVTLGTLGYGDIVPNFGPIQMLASLEAIIGQLYIATLVARLVSMHKKDNSKEPFDGIKS